MPSILLPLLPGTLPPGICYTSEQERLVGFAENLQAILESGQTYYNYGDTVPLPEFQDFPWIRTQDMLIYTYSGNWITPRPIIDQDSNTRRIYAGSLAALVNYDGGNALAPSDRSGPFWEEDVPFIGRSPMHPGLIPGSDPAKTLALDEDYGAGSHAQTLAEMAAHGHGPLTGNQSFWGHRTGGAGGTGNVGAGTDSDDMATTASSGGSVAASLVHSVRGIYIIKPTSRLYRVAV